MKAHILTNKGTIKLNLFYDKAPITVSNFVNLSNRGYYNNLSFHRVINDFMIQGGCPIGTGTGGPGYNFSDEFHPDLTHNSPGILSMANAGPGTNGSQFFITHVPTPWLDNKHSVFGQVVEGQNIVDEIEQNDIIESCSIQRIGKEAEKWNAVDNFNSFKEKTSPGSRLLPINPSKNIPDSLIIFNPTLGVVHNVLAILDFLNNSLSPAVINTPSISLRAAQSKSSL